MEQYHAMLVDEICQFFSSQHRLAPLNTIFLGGGTPSTYPPKLLLDTFDILKLRVGFAHDAEITIEVNPGTVTQEKLDAWRKAGINRLSIGVQSKNDAVLKGLNRHQKFSDVLKLLEMAAPLFLNISVDLIVGLPGVTNQEWRELVNHVVSWPITHVSLYFLTVHEDTPLYFGVKQNKIVLPSDDTVVDLYNWTREQFESAGLHQYEISNFARTGFQSKHNSVYWQRQPYKGVGLGACSFDGQSRFQNEKNLLNYLGKIEKNESVTIFSERLNEKQVWLEKLMLGLRQTAGIDISTLLPELSDKEQRTFIKTTDLLVAEGMLSYQDSMLRLTPAGLAVCNEIIVKLSSI